jgi:hypothetical protein
MAVNNSNKRQNYDNSWNHIEVCNEKWCDMDTHQVCNNSNTTGVSSGTGPFTLPEHMRSPQYVHVLEGFMLFILSNYMSMSLRFRTVIYYDAICCSFLLSFVFFLFFGSSCFFKILFAFTDVQHDFHVRWCSCRLRVTPRVAQTGKELIILPIRPELLHGFLWGLWYWIFVDHCFPINVFGLLLWHLETVIHYKQTLKVW